MANSGIITTGNAPALLKAKGKDKSKIMNISQGSVKDRIGAIKMNCITCGKSIPLKDIDSHMKECKGF